MKWLPRLVHAAHQLRWMITRPVTLGVRVLLVKDGAVLLVRHTYQSLWFLPGGGVKRGETLEQAARREAAEEVGVTLGSLSLLGVYTNFFEHKSDHVVVFVCVEFEMTGQRDREIEAHRFYRFGELPADLASGHRRRINEYVSGSGSCVGTW